MILDELKQFIHNVVSNEKTDTNELREFVKEEIENTINNGGDGSGDFDHAGRPGKVGGSEPAGTGRNGKYDNKDDKTTTSTTKQADKKEDNQNKILDIVFERDRLTKEMNKKGVLKDLKMPKSLSERQKEDLESGELVDITEDYYNRIDEETLKKEFKSIQDEFKKWKDKKNFPEYSEYKETLLKIKEIYKKRFGKTKSQETDKKEEIEEIKKSDIEADLKKEGKRLEKVELEQPKEVNKKEGDIEIKKETEKAYLLNKDGVNFWVQKRWYKDEKLTPAGEKSLEEAKYQLKKKQDEKTKTVGFKPSWESEKAYGVDFRFNNLNTGYLYNVRVFLPKSQVKDGKIPFWLYKKKEQEAYEKAGYNAYKGDYGSDFDWNDINNSKEELYTIIDGELYKIVDDNEKNKEETEVKNGLTTILNSYDYEELNDSDKEIYNGLKQILNDYMGE